MNNIYWIQYDKNTNKLTNISDKDKSDQKEWYLVSVDNGHLNYFKKYYKNIQYNPDSETLTYPDNISLENDLINNNNYVFDSLTNNYNNKIANINSSVQKTSDNIKSMANSATSNIQDFSNQISDIRGIAQIQNNKNYLTSEQQNALINYVAANTPINIADIFDGLPSLDAPISLAFTVDSPKWEWIAPQFTNKQGVTTKDNNVIISGSNAKKLHQILNVQLSKDQSIQTVWNILHFGSDINITNCMLYYGDLPSMESNHLQKLSEQVNNLQNFFSLIEPLVNKSTQSNHNYMSPDAQKAITNYILYNVPLNIGDMSIFKGIPNLTATMEISITINSSYWNVIKPQLQNKPNVKIQNHNILLIGNGINDLIQTLNDQFSQKATSVWSILHYGSDIHVTNIGLYYP